MKRFNNDENLFDSYFPGEFTDFYDIIALWQG